MSYGIPSSLVFPALPPVLVDRVQKAGTKARQPRIGRIVTEEEDMTEPFDLKYPG